ncbi:MMPL family transporter [Alicyclobacillus dauci]|uniref:MMPL family transporter n=1 Tax=Alicyclobacillus dauci TaxID=1475485 RepID=A0ABY6Z1K7_9BACL|nr:MMPL family transporter [Alicyclobacillus dauci]WAH36706.1 MMPL family transporter [Alicyclobacillus dauci]
MLERYATFIHKFRFLIMIVWVVLTAAAYVGLPSLSEVVSHKSTQFLPSNSTVVVSQNLLQQINPSQTSKSTAVVAMNNPRGLTDADKQYFRDKLSALDRNHEKYGVESVQDVYNTDASVSSKFNSSDHTVQIAVIGFPKQDVDQATADSLKHVKSVFSDPPKDAKILFTGDVPIQQDQVSISLNGAAKTAVVTVILVLVILLIVFRSVVTPLVTLLAIGLSYLMSSSIVGWLGSLGLPVSTFTNTFLIAIIFGAGTDYSIIILNRFREEIGHGQEGISALASALRGITKTVIFSALTVFVSFAILYFAHFGLYQTAVGVAVGIFITLVACLTFIPALILSLGRIVFWPRKIGSGVAHKPSRIWGATAHLALNYPWRTLLGIAIVLIPIGLLFTDKRTFDPMSDIPGAPSVTGFNTVARAFGPGDVMPMDIVIKSPQDLRTSEGLTTIENVSNAVAKLNGVHEVDSATRPQGKVIQAFQLANQNTQAASGLSQVQNGLNSLANQFNTVSGSQGTQKLVSGAQGVSQGANELSHGLTQTASQTGQLVQGAAQVQQGAQSLAQGQNQLSKGASATATGARQVAAGLAQASEAAQQVSNGATQLNHSQAQLAQSASNLANALAAWAKAHPSATADPSWQQIEKLAQGTAQGVSQAAKGTQQLSNGMSQLSGSLSKLQNGAQQVSKGTQQVAVSGQKLAAASAQIANGSKQVATGTGRLQTGLQQLSQGANQLASGSSQLAGGVSTLSSSLSQLNTGLVKANQALNQLSGGVGQVRGALNQSSKATSTGNPGFYVPPSALNNASMQKAIDAYVSKDGHIADIRVILSTNPYSMESINRMPAIQQQAEAAFIQSPIHSGQMYLSGTTPTQAELNRVSSADFTRTMALVLVAIFLILVLLLRSIISPLYIIASLAGTYFVTMGILQTVSVHVLGKAGVSWTIPFFVFLLLVALGVDYSIFLMSRFDEELKSGRPSIRSAMHSAMKNMGNVIFSAAAIMAGTFGSMAVAGVTSLVEIGISIIVGLFVYSFILLAFFVPACAAVVGEGHFWPFRRPDDSAR